VKEQVRGSATRAVTGHTGFAAIGIEDANLKIRRAVFRLLGDRNAVCAGAIMPIADAASEITEVTNSGHLLGFKDYVVVAEALEFRKARHRSRSSGRSRLLWFAKNFPESSGQHRLDIQQPLVNRELPAMIHFVRDGK